MNEAHQPVRHLDKVMTWHLAVPLWLSSTGILFVTAILSVIGLLFNVFSVGSSNRTLSFAAFDSSGASIERGTEPSAAWWSTSPTPETASRHVSAKICLIFYL